MFTESRFAATKGPVVVSDNWHSQWIPFTLTWQIRELTYACTFQEFGKRSARLVAGAKLAAAGAALFDCWRAGCVFELLAGANRIGMSHSQLSGSNGSRSLRPLAS